MSTAGSGIGVSSVTPAGARESVAMNMASDIASAGSDNRATGDVLFALGLEHATGAQADLVTAHKWFNLAAMQGNKEAARLRLEIAVEMSQADIAAAQRAARVWLRSAS